MCLFDTIKHYLRASGNLEAATRQTPFFWTSSFHAKYRYYSTLKTVNVYWYSVDDSILYSIKGTHIIILFTKRVISSEVAKITTGWGCSRRWSGEEAATTGLVMEGRLGRMPSSTHIFRVEQILPPITSYGTRIGSIARQ